MREKSDNVNHAIVNGKIEIPMDDQSNPKTRYSDTVVLDVGHKKVVSDEESDQSSEEIPQRNIQNNDESPVSINSEDDLINDPSMPEPGYPLKLQIHASNRYGKSQSVLAQGNGKKPRGNRRDSKFQNLELDHPDAFPPSNRNLQDLSLHIYHNENPNSEQGRNQAGCSDNLIHSTNNNILSRNLKNLNENVLESHEMARFTYQTRDENEKYAEDHEFDNATGDDHIDNHIPESPLVDKNPTLLINNLRQTNAEISQSENEVAKMRVDYSELLEKVKKQYQYLMQLKENTFELQMGIDVLNMQLERLNDQKKQELEETRQLELKNRSLVEAFEKQKQSLKRSMEALSKQELQNSIIRQKIEATGVYATQLKEIAQFVEQDTLLPKRTLITTTTRKAICPAI